MAQPTRPQRPIRRFDVFAEYRKQEQEADGTPTAEAKGYGLWVAKVVAAGRSRGGHGSSSAASGARAHPAETDGPWHVLDGQPQTDERFDQEVVNRMGADFYRHVFAPAIAEARRAGEPYEAIRDRIRRDWQPLTPASPRPGQRRPT
jgi:hypothetical protein